MAWTTPKTFTAGDKLLASELNTHLRDNLNALFNAGSLGAPAWLAIDYLTSNVTKSADTTLANLTNVSFAVDVSEIWFFIAPIFVSSNTTADAKFGLTYPSGTTGRWAVANSSITGGSDSIAATLVYPSIGTGVETAILTGNLVTSSTSGTVQVQFAQNTSDAVSTIAYLRSTMLALRIS